MISFRTHVVTLVALMLTLAAGVALGGGPLSEVGRGELSSARTAPAEETVDTADFGDAFARSSAARLYDGGLEGRTVTVLTLPGAPADVVSGLTAGIEQAGGSITATYAAQPALLAPDEKSLVDTLGSQLMTQLEGDTVDAAAPTYERMGQLLGTAVASTEPSGSPATPDADAIRQSLSGAELVVGPDGDPKRAPLVLVVLGEDVDDDVLAGLLAGLAARSVGVVAVGDTGAGSGDLAGLRISPLTGAVGTVDGADRDLGQVTSVLALIRALKTSGGSFGASGSDGPVPLR